MGRALLILATASDKEKARAWINRAPWNTRVTFQGPRRTVPQNDLQWAALTDISQQVLWHGQHYSPEDWKDWFMHALKRGRWMPDEDGGMVPVGMSTSGLSKEEFSDLLEIIKEFCARHEVKLNEPAPIDEEKN